VAVPEAVTLSLPVLIGVVVGAALLAGGVSGTLVYRLATGARGISSSKVAPAPQQPATTTTILTTSTMMAAPPPFPGPFGGEATAVAAAAAGTGWGAPQPSQPPPQPAGESPLPVYRNLRRAWEVQPMGAPS
jgi:hypothetical protein